MDDLNLLLAASIKRARTAAGWSQRELAERAGVHQPQVARAERGEDLQLSLLRRLARPLGLVPTLAPALTPRAESPAITVATTGKSIGASTPAELRDEVDTSLHTWSAAWPQVDPQVFAVLARLRRAGLEVENATAKVAAIHGMSGREVMVLGALRRSGAPYENTPTGLKQVLWISLPGLKKQLDRLESLGMITRVSNPQDRRGLVVRLTSLGDDALNDLVSHPQASVYKALLNTPPAQLAELSELLRALLSKLESVGEGLPY